jgi:glutamate formiminotransferase
MEKIVESVPNFSEGRDPEKIERIVGAFRNRADVLLLDYSADADHNRMVATVAGSPEAVAAAVVEAVGQAVALIDLTRHSGRHPRIGAADVVPFIPLRGMTVAEASALAADVGRRIAERYFLPVYLYEDSATAPHRHNLADVRRGEFEGLSDKMLQPEWKPDFGPAHPHPTAGAAVVGARSPLIAFNVVLDSDNIEIARAVARRIRFSSGGLPACKAIGVDLQSRGCVQVSMNLTDYRQTSMYAAFEAVRREAEQLGVAVAGSELIGLVPMQAVADVAAEALHLEKFSVNRIIETFI